MAMASAATRCGFNGVPLRLDSVVMMACPSSLGWRAQWVYEVWLPSRRLSQQAVASGSDIRSETSFSSLILQIHCNNISSQPLWSILRLVAILLPRTAVRIQTTAAFLPTLNYFHRPQRLPLQRMHPLRPLIAHLWCFTHLPIYTTTPQASSLSPPPTSHASRLLTLPFLPSTSTRRTTPAPRIPPTTSGTVALVVTAHGTWLAMSAASAAMITTDAAAAMWKCVRTRSR
jgi:hypothetical protein